MVIFRTDKQRDGRLDREIEIVDVFIFCFSSIIIGDCSDFIPRGPILDKLYLVQPFCLSVPLFNAVERGLAGQIEHEKDRDGFAAYNREHADKFALPWEMIDE